METTPHTRYRVLSMLLLILTAGALLSLRVKGANGAATTTAVPLLLQAAPPSAAPGTNDLAVKVTGVGFVSGATVNWNGAPLATTFVSQAQLIAVIPASELVGVGTHSLTVSNPGITAASNAVLFPVATSLPFAAYMYQAIVGSGAGSGVAVGDLNGDGKPDIVALSTVGGDSAIVLLGNGDSTFQQLAPLSLPYFAWPSIGDFNGDGIADIVTTGCIYSGNCTSSDDLEIEVFLGKGDGTFGTPIVRHGLPSIASFGVVEGDFNRDGNLDIAYTNQTAGGNGELVVLLGNGNGTFQKPQVFTSGFSSPLGLAVADFNGDGNLDFAVANEGSPLVSVMLGNGDGTFQHPINSGVRRNPVRLAAGDFNGDGYVDVAVTEDSGNSVGILLGNGNGSLQSAVYYMPGGESTLGIADFNDDGKLDLAVPNSILIGNGNGTFSEPAQKYTLLPGANMFGSLAADFNNDGRLDLVGGLYSGTGLAVIMEQGTVTLSKTTIQFPATPVGQSSTKQSLLLTNVGNASLTNISLSIAGTESSDFKKSVGSCVGSILPGASCSILLGFAPSQTGSRTATLQINDSAPGGTQSVTLQGMGTN